jgi:hypothetical protein
MPAAGPAPFARAGSRERVSLALETGLLDTHPTDPS